MSNMYMWTSISGRMGFRKQTFYAILFFCSFSLYDFLVSFTCSRWMCEEGRRSPLKQIYALTKFQTYYCNFSRLYHVFAFNVLHIFFFIFFFLLFAFYFIFLPVFFNSPPYTWKIVNKVEHFVLARLNGLIS